MGVAGAYGNETWSGAYGGTFYDVTAPAIYPRLVKNASSAVVVMPGGAYKWLSWELEGESAATWPNSINASVFILKYRVPARSWLPFGGAPLMDAQRAMGVIRSQFSKYNLSETTKLGVLGFSAGSHLSAHISNDFQQRSYPRIDAADDIGCRPDFAMLLYPWCIVGDNSASASSCNADRNHTLTLPVSKDTPATFVVQAANDPVHVENSLLYTMALKQMGSPSPELHIYPTGGHGFGLCKSALEVCTWPERATQYLFAQKLI